MTKYLYTSLTLNSLVVMGSYTCSDKPIALSLYSILRIKTKSHRYKE